MRKVRMVNISGRKTTFRKVQIHFAVVDLRMQCDAAVAVAFRRAQ